MKKINQRHPRKVILSGGCRDLVRTGAACAASKGEKSHVLTAIGLSDSEIAGSLRISMGKQNDEETIKIAAEKLAKIVKNELERIHG